MHCGKERGGRWGLIVAGVCYIFPAMVICLLFGYFYRKYSALPNVQDFIFGLRPATTALVIATVFRLAASTLKNKITLVILCLLVFAASLAGINEVLLILAAGLINYMISAGKHKIHVFSGLLYAPLLLQIDARFQNEKLFLIFLKIGTILYGSGFVLFAYMDESLVRNNHWLNRQQLADAIAVGQITPGPILSSATFAGYLINGLPGGLLATFGIFLPSFFISFFLHRLVSSARKNQRLRVFLDGLSAASISIIAVVGLHLLTATVGNWRGTLILICCLALTLVFKKISSFYIILLGSVAGFIMLKV